MWSASLNHSILDDHKPAIQINLEHLTYGRVCPVDRIKLPSSRPHESESRVQAASTFGSGFDSFARETTRTFKISRCLQLLPFLTLRAAPTYETSLSLDAVSAADAAPATNRGQVIDIVLGTVFVSSGLTACANRSRPLGSGRSHPRLVGSREHHVPPPNAGPGATGTSGSAARPPVSYALREYGGHVPAFGFCPVCLAGADSWQAQRFASAGNPRRVGNRFGWYWHLRPRGCRTSPPLPKARFPASQQQTHAPSARTPPGTLPPNMKMGRSEKRAGA